MRSLLVKELYQLRPIIWLLLSLTALSVLATLFSERIDEYRFAAWCEVFCQPGTPIDYGISLIVILLIVAYSLFPHEHDESTIDFLHALPVSRGRIFIAKLSAAALLLTGLIVADYALSALLLSANTQSLDGRFYASIFVPQLILELCFSFIILAHGILLSWFRLAGLLVYALYLAAVVLLESRYGALAVFSVFSVLQVDIVGQSLQLAWHNIAIHGAIALLLLYIAFRLWSRDLRHAERSEQRRRSRWLVIAATLMTFVLAAAIMGYQSSGSSADNTAAGFDTVSTEHYRFVARSSALERMDTIVRHADTDYRALIDMLGMQQQPFIQADMTSDDQHALGVASWKKIRMNIAGFESDRQYRRILSHETTHAFQAVESERKVRANFNATKFFIEGMAQYTSFTIVDEPELRDSNWQLAAVAWKRQGIEFADVVDFARFQNRFDENLVYTLGDIWAQAMVDACAERVLGDFLRALAAEAGSASPSAREFWRRTLAHTGCELEAVIDRWERLLEDVYSALQSDRFPLLPEPRIQTLDGTDRLRLSLALPDPDQANAPQSYHLKVRDTKRLSTLPDAVYRGRISEAKASQLEFILPARLAAQGRLRYQLGYIPKSGARVYFQRWQRGSIDSATADPE